MKKLLTLFAVVLISTAAFSQTSGVTLTAEDYEKLSPELKSQITAIQVEKEITGNLETTGKWVGMGKEIGTAVNESLVAITSTASTFAETKVGKFTMFLVAYKVIGRDMLQVIIGIIWIIIVLIVSGLMYHNNIDKYVLSYKKWIPEAKKFEKKYELLNGDDDFKGTAVAVLVVGLLISLAIIFF